MNSLLIRYVPLLAHPCVIDSENVKVILNKVIMDLVYKQLSLIQKDLMENNLSSYEQHKHRIRFSNGNEEYGCYESITSYAIYGGQSHKYETSTRKLHHH